VYCVGIFGVSRQVVAGAAYEALMKFDRQLQLGMQQHLQRVNYVNTDAETTSVFIQTFTASRHGQHPHMQGLYTEPRYAYN